MVRHGTQCGPAEAIACIRSVDTSEIQVMTDPASRPTPGTPPSTTASGRSAAAPFDDLVALVAPIPGGRLVDLGCGSGELTDSARRTLSAGGRRGHRLVQRHAVRGRGARRARTVLRRRRHRRLRRSRRLGRRDRQRLAAVGRPTTRPCWHGGPTASAPGASSRCRSPPTPTIRPTPPSPRSWRGPFADRDAGWSPTRWRQVLDPARYAEVLWSLGATDPARPAPGLRDGMPSADDVVRWVSGTALVTGQRATPGRTDLDELRRSIPGTTARSARPRVAVLLRVQAHPHVGGCRFARPRDSMRSGLSRPRSG